jgi:hypothetical protein
MGKIARCRSGARDGQKAYEQARKGQARKGRDPDDDHRECRMVAPSRRTRVQRLKRCHVIQEPDGSPHGERQCQRE